MAYTFDPVFAVDPNNPANVAKNASITIFDPADVSQAPIAITDPTGVPLDNPITVDAAGMGPAYQHPTLARVGWKGAGFTGYFTSYEGMYNETQAAKVAAQAAETAASTAGTNAASAASAALAGAVADAEAAQAAAAASAALVGAPADTAIAAAINGSGTATKTALNATYVPKSGAAWNVKDFGAKGDFKTVADANATGDQLSSPSYNFTGQDVGKRFTVYTTADGRGLNANHVNGTITAVSGGVATLSAAVPSPLSGVRFDWASDDRAAIQAAIDAAMADDTMTDAGIAREIVFDPSVSTWWVGGPLVIGTAASPGTPVTLRGGCAAGAEIGGTYLKNRGLIGKTIIQKADSKAGHDIIQHYGNGLSIQRIALDGRMAAGHLLNVSFAFELRLKEVHLMRSYTTGLRLQTCNNSQIDDLHVNYCGNGRTWPAVKVLSTLNGDGSLSPSNTFHWNNVHIEYNSGVDLDLGSGATGDEYAEFHKFNQLHIEATIANFYNTTGGSVNAKNVPSLVIGNVRSVNFTNSMFYAKGQAAVEIKSQASIAGVEYGATFVGCDFVGVSGVDRLVDVIAFRDGTASFVGCKFSGAQLEYVRIDAAYAGVFSTAGNTFGENIAPIPSVARINDLRATLKARFFESLTTDRDAGVVGTGHIVARTPETNLRPTIAAGSGMGTGMAAPSISGSDTAGQITFATGTTPTADNVYFTVTFRKAFAGGTARVFLTPANSATAKLGQPYIGVTGTNWAVYFPTALTGGQTNLQYNYLVVGSVA